MMRSIFSFALAMGLATRAVTAVPTPLSEQSTGADDLEALYKPIIQEYYDTLVADNVYQSEFYHTAGNFSERLAPGTVLKVNDVSNTSLNAQYAYPTGLHLYRIMYTSKTIHNKIVPATGFMLLPYQKNYKDSDSARTLVWTHGTSGATRDCAPSSLQGLMYSWRVLFLMAIDGYIVIAPDYVGQGAEGEFHYMSGVEHAGDAANMLKAAREAFPGADIKDWAVIGHSEGGMTAWVTNQEQKKNPSGGFLGAVSLAPSLAFSRTFTHWFSTPELRKKLYQEVHLGTMYSLFVLRSIHHLVPSLDPMKYLTSVGKQLFALISKNGCDWDAPTLLQPYSVDEIYSDYSWTASPQAEEWINRTENNGLQPLEKPMLIIQGDADVDVPAQDTLGHYKQHCSKFSGNSPVSFHYYPREDHSGVIWASYTDYYRFLNDLFNHKKDMLPSGCSLETINPSFPGENVEINFSTLVNVTEA